MVAEPSRSLRRTLATFAAVYGAWLVTIVLGALIVYLWHGAMRELYIRLRLNVWGFAAYQNTVILLLVLGWLVLVIAAEGWYRNGAAQGRLVGRVATLVLAEVVLILGAVLILR